MPYSVGIDFGTSGTGYAFTPASKADVRTVEVWPGQPKPYCKTLTAVLYDRHTWQAIAFGWEAYKQFISMRDSNQHERHLYLEKFKLTLADREDRTSALALIAATDSTSGVGGGLPEELTPLRVIGDCLRFFREHALRTLNSSYHSVKLQEVTWALSVPAGWSEASKQKMRLAAVDAGIVDSADSSRLMLVHEPEAAAMTVISRLQDPVPLKEHDTFIIVDAGGGTTDMTCHKVIRRDQRLVLTEATHKEGELVGSTLVDEIVKQWLAKSFPPGVWASWKHKHPNQYVKIVHDTFESQKCAFDGTAPLKIELHNSLLNMIPQQVLARLAASQDQIDDELWIPVEEAKAMFDKPINVIINAVQRVLERIDGSCDYMLLVGGFGESEYLKRRVRAAFSGAVRRRIVSPDRPSAAVVKGAAMYAAAPDMIFSRRTRFCYGVEVSQLFRPGLRQDLKFIEPTTGKVLCDKYFNRLVKRDELVEHDQVVTHSLRAVQRYQSSVPFHIYTCENNTDRYVDSDSMKRLGEVVITIDHPDCVHDPDKYTFTLSFTLGSVELKVTAVDDQTQRKAQTTVAFIAEA